MLSLPAIDVRACVFAIAPQAATANSVLFNDITDRITATYTLCVENLGVQLVQAQIHWPSMNKQGVQVVLQTQTNEIPFFIPWVALENEASMAAFVAKVTNPAPIELAA